MRRERSRRRCPWPGGHDRRGEAAAKQGGELVAQKAPVQRDVVPICSKSATA
jgi:hypothetical protein